MRPGDGTFHERKRCIELRVEHDDLVAVRIGDVQFACRSRPCRECRASVPVATVSSGRKLFFVALALLPMPPLNGAPVARLASVRRVMPYHVRLAGG